MSIPDRPPRDPTAVPPEVEFEKRPENRIVVATQGPLRHPSVVTTERQLCRLLPDRTGRVIPPKGCPNVYVSRAMRGRALRIMDALLLALDQRKVQVADPAQTSSRDGIQFRLAERLRQLSRKQRAAAPLRYHQQPNGTLMLEIINAPGQGRQTRWQDDKRGKLEDQLNSFVIGLTRASVELAAFQQTLARQEAERAERKRQWLEHERRVRQLHEGATRWQQYELYRGFVAELRRRLEGETFPVEVTAWLSWAEQFVDQLNPLQSRTAILNHLSRG